MCATVVAKAIGACYRIPLTNILGAEGMGLYQLVFPVYSLLLSLSSGAFPMAVSVIVSSRIAAGNIESARGVVRSTVVIIGIIGAVLSCALAGLSGVIGKLQGAADAWLGYIAIAPSVFFVAIMSVYKGWFQGNGRMGPTATTQVIEAVIKLALGLSLAYVLRSKGLAFAVSGALCGVTLGEVASTVFLAVLYRRGNRFDYANFEFSRGIEDYKQVLALSMPIMLSGMVFPIVQFADSFLVVNILSRAMDTADATIAYGLITGPVGTLINLPIALGLAIGIAVAPRLSEDRERRKIDPIRLKISTAVKTSIAVGVPFAVLYITAPEAVLTLLYRGLKAGEIAESCTILRIGAVGILFLSVSEICTSVLQGLGDTMSPVKNLAVAGGLKITLDVVLLFTVGLIGAEVASVVAYGVAAVLNAISIAKLTGKYSDIVKKSGVIIVLGGIIGVPTTVATLFGIHYAAVLAVACVAGVMYIVSLTSLPIFEKEEILGLPFGSFLLGARLKPRHSGKE